MGKNSLIQWATKHKGGLKAIRRRNGIAYLYRYSYNRQHFCINFPAGTPPDFIRLKILEAESTLLKQRLGLTTLSAAEPALSGGEASGAEAPAPKNLGDLLTWYHDIATSEQIAPDTRRRRKYELNRLVNFFGKKFPLHDFNRNQLNDYKRHLLKTNANGAYWTLQKLQTIFRQAHYENFIPQHPFLSFQYPRLARGKAYPTLTTEEMQHLASHFHTPQMQLAWNLARFTAIRGSDLYTLHWHNFDFTNSLITFICKKTHRPEKLIIHPQLHQHLQNHRQDHGPLFTFKNPGSLGLEFRKKIHRLKGPDFTPCGTHTPRHSLGAYLRNVAKWPRENIALFLTHTPQGVTGKYTHDNIELIREPVSQLPFK